MLLRIYLIKVPVVEVDTNDVPGLAATQISMYPHPGSSHNASSIQLSLSDSWKSIDYPRMNRYEETPVLPLTEFNRHGLHSKPKKIKLNTSLNEGKT